MPQVKEEGINILLQGLKGELLKDLPNVCGKCYMLCRDLICIATDADQIQKKLIYITKEILIIGLHDFL